MPRGAHGGAQRLQPAREVGMHRPPCPQPAPGVGQVAVHCKGLPETVAQIVPLRHEVFASQVAPSATPGTQA